jgi:hypothetical protein
MATNGGSVTCAGATLGQHRHICAFFNDFDEQHRVLVSDLAWRLPARKMSSTARRTVTGGAVTQMMQS